MKLSITDWHIVQTDVRPTYPALMWCWNDDDEMAEVHTVVSSTELAATTTYTVDDVSQPYTAQYQNAVPLADLIYGMPDTPCRHDNEVILGRIVLAYDDADAGRLYLRTIGYKHDALFVEHAADCAGYDHVIEPEEPHIEYAAEPIAYGDCAKTSYGIVHDTTTTAQPDTYKTREEPASVKRSSVAEVLASRGTKHGDFMASSGLATDMQFKLRQSPNWTNMRAHQRRALNMIIEKITRICYGDPSYADHWVDIAGYATLGKEGCHE